MQTEEICKYHISTANLHLNFIEPDYSYKFAFHKNGLEKTMLKCNRITRLVSQQQEQSLPFSQLIQVKMHRLCSRCHYFC